MSAAAGECQPLCSSHQSKQHRLCPFSYRFQFIHSKGALLVVFWSLMINIYQQFGFMWLEIMSPVFEEGFGNAYIIGCITLVYPLMGLIGDCWVNRYKIVITCITFCMILVLILWSQLIAISFGLHATMASVIVGYVSFGSLYLISSAFEINLITFNIDQLIGLSGDELSAVIHWHNVMFFASAVLFFLLLETAFHRHYICLLICSVCISAVFVSHSCFKHWLDTIPQTTTNPLKLIARVLHYARKHKYPENRSALTYWEEEAPSRLDLGKEKYGGPFTEEEVEDVKTIFRLIPLFVSNSVLGFVSFDFYGLKFNPTMETDTLNSVPIISSLIFLFLLYPCFHCYIPNLLKRIALGMFLGLLGSGIYSVLFLLYSFQNIDCILNASTITHYHIYKWVPLIPELCFGLAYYFIRVLSMEFTLAQSPKAMRGLMVGLLMLSKGLGSLIIIAVGHLIEHFLSSSSKCGFYFSISRTCLILVLFILFVCLASKYKYRVRSNEINVHIIAEDHIQRYMDQSDEYRNNNDLIGDNSLSIVSLN